jgi:hypothetical protein
MQACTCASAARHTKGQKARTSHARGSSGSALQIDPSTTSIGGSSACSPRAMIDLAVPRRPEIAMPPSPVSTAPSSSASLIASCPTTAVSGKERASFMLREDS